MGMSSSQARLLSLTARLHSIEHKAQKIEAEKLRLANDSSRAYDAYLAKLEASKIQYSALSSNGAISYRDANLNAMENRLADWNSETSDNTLFLQTVDGKTIVTPAIAAKFGFNNGVETRSLDEFVQQTTGKNKSERDVMKQVPVYRKEEVMETVDIEDRNIVLNYNKIENITKSEPVINRSHTLNPIANVEGGVDYSALEGYAKFDDNHTEPAEELPEVSNDTSFVSGKTYVISDAEGLVKLMNANSSANMTIVLANDIDMTDVEWTGIKNFAGTFDGNGFTISNLSGTNGLFASTSGANIKNVGLENVNINGNSQYVGGLIGYASNTNVTNCYTTGSVTNSYNNTIDSYNTSSSTGGTGGLIGQSYVSSGRTITYDNVYANTDTTGINAVGGLIGSSTMSYGSTKFDIKNSYAIGNVTGQNAVGGFAGFMYNDEDNTSDITDIRNCYSGGTVNGNTYVGGFLGTYTYWGDRGDFCEIEHCNSTGKVIASNDSKVGAFAGNIFIKSPSQYGANAYVKFIDCGFADNTGVENGYGQITDYDGKDVSSYVLSSGTADGLVSFKIAGSIPSINEDGSGDFMQNIIAALIKAEAYDPCDPEVSNSDKANMEASIKNFIKSFGDNDTDNSKLWNLNDAINSYVNGTGDDNFGDALIQDITNGTTTATASYQVGTILDGKVTRAIDSKKTIVDGNHDIASKGQVEIPSFNNIAESIYFALKVQRYDLDEATVKNWVNNNYNSANDEDKMLLANLNNDIQNPINLSNIKNAIDANQKYYNNSNYPVEKYEIIFANDKDLEPSYGTQSITRGTGVFVDVVDHYIEEFDYTEAYWDTTDEDIANAIAMYAIAQRGIIVATEEQAASCSWLVNMINAGEAVLTTFNPQAAAINDTTSANELINMSDVEYEEVMGIKNTSVSVETFVREVADDKELKIAEAQYEADMLKINKKERLYDTDLAKVENERNAIKQEIETLKTVAKENVDRTFKLFS